MVNILVGKIIIGVSAGGIIPGPTPSIAAVCEEIPDEGIPEGLGFVDWIFISPGEYVE